MGVSGLVAVSYSTLTHENGVDPFSTVPEIYKICTKAHWNFSGGISESCLVNLELNETWSFQFHKVRFSPTLVQQHTLKLPEAFYISHLISLLKFFMIFMVTLNFFPRKRPVAVSGSGITNWYQNYGTANSHHNQH